MLYERNWDRQRVIDLFNVIDPMMRIPAQLQSKLMRDIGALERNRGMVYISSFERVGLERGRQEGRQEGQSMMLEFQMTKRFGELPLEIRERIAGATSAELKAWGEAVLDAPTLESVFAGR